MARLDVYPNPKQGTRKPMPHLLDVQAELLGRAATQVVVPQVLAEEMTLRVKQLNPQFNIKGVALVMSTAELAGIPARACAEKMTSVKRKRGEIVAALVLLFTGS